MLPKRPQGRAQRDCWANGRIPGQRRRSGGNTTACRPHHAYTGTPKALPKEAEGIPPANGQGKARQRGRMQQELAPHTQQCPTSQAGTERSAPPSGQGLSQQHGTPTLAPTRTEGGHDKAPRSSCSTPQRASPSPFTRRWAPLRAQWSDRQKRSAYSQWLCKPERRVGWESAGLGGSCFEEKMPKLLQERRRQEERQRRCEPPAGAAGTTRAPAGAQ